MKKILFFLFLSLSAFLNANEKNNKLVDLLHSFGNNGEYAQMDSVYNLIIHEDHYKQDKLYALNITLDYARFLNQKGEGKYATYPNPGKRNGTGKVSRKYHSTPAPGNCGNCYV